MKIQLKNKEVIDFDDLTVLDDENKPLYKLQHFAGNDYFTVVKLNGVIECIDDKEFMKSDNVIIVR